MEKRWEILPRIPDDFKEKFPEINPIILQLLYNRGLRFQKEIDEFLLPDYSQDIHDPFIFQDMEKAVARIYRAIKNKEKILIYGDYDTDGVTATSVLFNAFKTLGAQDLLTYLPDREKEGFGLNKKAIENFVSQEVNLIVTCDNGTTNVEEVDLAASSGVDVIITDHHLESNNLPKAYAIINPNLGREKYPFRGLAGVGVAFKLVQALLARGSQAASQPQNPEAFEKWLLDLVAIGTVGDMMPILGENRALVKYGLVVLNKTKNLGLRYLIEKAGLALGNLDAHSIAFQISPRLNSAGRMNHANDALELLLVEAQSRAEELAEKLNSLNTSRQKEIDGISEGLKKELGEAPKAKILLAEGEWKIGIIGIIAARLLDWYHRPALVFSTKGDRVKASGRAPSFFNLFEVLNRLREYYSGFGGHAGAAGFTLKNPADFEKFKEDLSELAESQLKYEDFKPKISVDVEVALKDVNWELEEGLEKFRPFGIGNSQANFLLKGVDLKNVETVGQNGTHRRLIVGSSLRKLIYFNADNLIDEMKIGDKIDVIFQLDVNQWNGQQELQMKVIDLKKNKK